MSFQLNLIPYIAPCERDPDVFIIIEFYFFFLYDHLDKLINFNSICLIGFSGTVLALERTLISFHSREAIFNCVGYSLKNRNQSSTLYMRNFQLYGATSLLLLVS